MMLIEHLRTWQLIIASICVLMHLVVPATTQGALFDSVVIAMMIAAAALSAICLICSGLIRESMFADAAMMIMWLGLTVLLIVASQEPATPMNER